jgi:nitrite reductase/ring-hydroxylating ferredoxin subunit
MEYSEKVSRHDFLKKLGFSGASLWAIYCSGTLSSCKSSDVTPIVVSQFSINLDDISNSPLKTNGGYIIKNDVVIAKTANGDYAAVSILCRHENLTQVIYQKGANEFYCTAHGARYDLKGNGLNQNGSKGIVSYPVMIMDNGKSLMIG